MKHKLTSRIKRYFRGFLITQLTCTLVSLPILVYWGIPTSLMSIVGNLIFLPFLTIFLLLSSFIFFTELIGIPNGIFVYLLNSTTQLWDYFLHFGKKEWCIGFASPTLFTTITIALAISILIIKKYIPRYYFIINSLLISTALLFFIFYSPSHTQKTFFVPGTKDTLRITTHTDNTITITDNGCFNKKQSPEKWISFELKPYLTQKFGTIHIRTLILKKATTRTFVATKELCELVPIKQVRLAYFDQKLNKYGWREFFNMKRTLEKHNIKFVRFKTQQKSKRPSTHQEVVQKISL